MQENKKCVRCNTVNPGSRIYCAKCGAFLLGNGAFVVKKTTIWDDQLGSLGVVNTPMVDSLLPIAPNPSGNNVRTVPEQYVVVCPQCNQVIPVNDGNLPMFCDCCIYHFQMGIDKIVPASVLHKNNSGAQKQTDGSNGQFGNSQNSAGITNGITTRGATTNGASRKNPLPRAQNDISSMRLISLTRKGVLPVSIDPDGVILGENGTVMTHICTAQQLSITHARSGWYVMVLKGQPLYNGVTVNSGIQIRLHDMDILTIEKEQFRVEIV